MTKIIRNRKIILPIGMVAAILAIGIMAAVYYLSPANYLSLDVNPSIELQTNRLNQVVSVNPVNEDAKQILAGYELTDRNLETVIKDIVDRMIVNGYIASDLDNEILISTEDKSTTSTLADTVNNIITAYLKEKQLAASTILQTVNATDEELQASHANNVSVGKMRLIQSLIANNSTLTVEELSGMRISDLLALSTVKNSSMDATTTEGQGVTEDLAGADNEAADQDNEDADENDDQGINEEADDRGNKEDAYEEDNEDADEDKDQSKYEDSEEDSNEGYNEDADEDNDQNDFENDESDGNHISKYSIKKDDQEDNHNSEDAYLRENREDNEDSEDSYKIENNEDNDDDDDGTASWSNNEDRDQNEDESGDGYNDDNEDED